MGPLGAVRRTFAVLVMAVGMLAGVVTPLAPQVARAAVDVGYADGSYSGASAPTGREPQSKLWFNDGIWWGSLLNPSRNFNIHRLNWTTQVWTDTGVVIDDRRKSSADALWDGTKLYIVSAISDQSNSSSPPTSGDNGIRVMRYSYSTATKAYSLDANFPVVIADAAVESVSLDRDSTGRIWVTWTYSNGSGRRNVLVTHSTVDTATYIPPYVIPVAGANNLDTSDYSAIVAYNGKIGVMWSNQTDNAMHFAFHVDGAPDTQWTVNNALSGPGWADNHMTIKSLQADAAGQIFAASKTSLNGDKCPPSAGNSQQPLILLLMLDGSGGWQRRTFSTAADCESRPTVLIDQQSRRIYLFATQPAPGSSYGSGGAIYYKSTSLDNPNFGPGPGTPFIQLAAHDRINNVTSTKQSVSPASGLVVLAGDDHTKTYVHNAMSLGTDTTPPTVTATSPTNGATGVPTSATVTATFSEPMAPASISGASVSLTDTTTASGVPAGVTYDGASQTASLSPTSALPAGHSFRATVGTAVTDLAGNHLATPLIWTFSTAAVATPDTTITAGPTGTVASTTASFSFTSTIAGSTFACSLDGAAYSACTSPAAYTGLTQGAHTFAVAASAGGVTDPTPATRSWVVDTTPTGALFSDDFESGNLGTWSTVSTGGGGTALAQSATVRSGTYAAHLTEASSGGSWAYARADLGAPQTELTISGDFRIAAEGSSSQNIPLFRLFDTGGTRRLSLYRQDVSGGIHVWDATGYHTTSASLALNTWAHVELHIIAGNGSGIATVELRIDGTLIYQVSNATLPPVRTVQIGNETKNQPMDLYVDNVAITGP